MHLAAAEVIMGTMTDDKVKRRLTTVLCADVHGYSRLMEACRDQGLLLGKGGMYGNVLRFSPPMNIGRADVDNFFGMLDKALASVGALAAGGVR